MRIGSVQIRLLRLGLFLIAVLQVGLILVVLERPAQAYVDPGSGYMLLQVAGSMAIGALYYLRHRVRRLFGLLRGKRATEPEPGSTIAAEMTSHKADQ